MATEFGKGKYNKYGQPSLDLVFTGPKKSLVDRVSGKSLQFTRNTIGTYVDANGIIQTAAAGEPRYTYDPATGEELGLLVEVSRTNLVTYSEDFGNWNDNGVAITVNSVTAPDGTTTADKILEDSSNGQHYVSSSNVATTPSTRYTYSLFAKTGERSKLVLALGQSTAWGSPCSVFFDLSAGVVTDIDSATANVSASIQNIGNGWYRCSMSADRNAIAAGAFAYVFLLDAAGNRLYQGDGVSGLYIWGAQLEAGSFPTSYIQTSGSTVSRDPDTVTLTNDNLYNNSQFDIVNDPFGMSAGSNTLTLLPSNSENSAIKRATIFSPNITQNNINSFAEKTDEFWRWRILGSSFGLPNFTTDGQVTVDWDDGTVETLTTSDHTFTDNKTYHEIGFRLDSGTYFRPRINGNITHKDKLIAIGPAPESMKIRALEAFNGCTNLQAFDPTIAANGETNYSYAWQSCSSLKNFPLIDTSGVTYMLRTWRFCSGLENFAKIDTSSVTSLYEAWDSCSSLTSFPTIDTSNVTDFGEAWHGCSSLTEFPVLDTSKGTAFSGAWQSCSSLTEFPSQIDVSKCSNFSVTWRYCGGLTSFPALDFSAATSFGYTWMSCSSLTSFPTLSTTSLVEQFIGPWYACSGLTTIPICDYSAGTNFDGAWLNCANLTTIPANLFDTTGTLAANAFRNAFVNDKLSAQSIENLLVSLVANGATGVTLNMNGGNNANTSTWSTAANNAYLELVNNRGWIITQNGTAPT